MLMAGILLKWMKD